MTDKTHTVISLTTLYPRWASNIVGRIVLSILDRIVGLHLVRRFYQRSNLAGLAPEAFCRQLVASVGRGVNAPEEFTAALPKSGSAIVVSNHPFGCVEGVALAQLMLSQRQDVKVLANKGLSMFTELEDIFIYINPLKPTAAENLIGIRQAKQHLNQGGILLVFPAGKVSYFRPEKQRICDDEWNRLPGALARSTDSPVLPIHISGHNSRFFITMGRVYFRFKLLLLFREFMSVKNQPLLVKTGRLLPTKLLAKVGNDRQVTDYLRVLSYIHAEPFRQSWPADDTIELQPLMPPVAAKLLVEEINALPSEQRLVDYKQFSVYFAKQGQAPNVVKDITRLRETVFRDYNEGSGLPFDGDEFDQTYLHLFIFDNDNEEIIGAYRMGQSDKLIEQYGIEGMYLAKMFNFGPDFINRKQPCLEMGRSFLVPKHQRSFYGLFLLWRGIGEFVVRHPQYRTLYGTVSLSKLYRPESVECISKLALTPCSNVSAKVPFAPANNPELDEYIQANNDNPKLLSLLVQGIERDGKDVPILMKQYEKLAARFYCIGIDQNFNQTPGLLLSVDLPNAPTKALKQYLADGLDNYINNDKGF